MAVTDMHGNFPQNDCGDMNENLIIVRLLEQTPSFAAKLRMLFLRIVTDGMSIGHKRCHG